MCLTRLIALSCAVGSIRLACAENLTTFKVTEPISIAGVPLVKLGPGSYVLRTIHESSGGRVVQVLNKRRDYLYTTVLTIPAERPHSHDSHQMLFSEASSGLPPTLHYWFPEGKTWGYEFVTPGSLPAPNPSEPPMQLHRRAMDTTTARQPARPDSPALNEALALIASGKLGAARDRFRRDYFLAQNRDGAFTSFLLALLLVDHHDAWVSLELVHRLSPERMKALSRLNAYQVVESLQNARSNLKTSDVRRFLLNLALEMIDDPIARTATLAFERHVVKVDSFPVEMALDQRRQEREKEGREQQWVVAIAKLSDCVKSLLGKVGALEYSATADGRFGSATVRVVLTQRRLSDLDAIAERSRRAICDRNPRLERLITQRNTAITRELNALRSALRELDRKPHFKTAAQFGSLRNWESALASGVSRDLMILAEAAASPELRPSSAQRSNRGSVQIDIAASLAKLAEWASY